MKAFAPKYFQLDSNRKLKTNNGALVIRFFCALLTIFPLPGSRVQVSKQLICGHSFRVDIIPYRLHLHVCVGSVESLQDLKKKKPNLFHDVRSVSSLKQICHYQGLDSKREIEGVDLFATSSMFFINHRGRKLP